MNTTSTQTNAAHDHSDSGTDDDTDERRAHLRAMWAAVAESWDEHADYTDARHASETQSMLDAVHLAAGDHVLELACGAGGLGLAAAQRLAPSGQVVLSDAPAEMVAIAARRAQLKRLTNVSTAQLELEQIDQPDHSFDVVLCRDGLQFVLDPTRAVREIHRVLRPGGRAAVAVWGPRQYNPWLAVVLDAVSAQLGKPVPPPGIPGPFTLDSSTDLSEMFTAAGFDEVVTESVAVRLEASSFDEWWTRTSGLAGPLTTILRSMPEAATAALHGRLRKAVQPYQTSTGLSFPGVALVASAKRS